MHLNTVFLRRSIAVIATSLLAASAYAQSVSFVEPADGATVTSPFKVKFAVSGMAVKPAGDMTAKTGHHHLLINTGPMKAGDKIGRAHV